MALHRFGVTFVEQMNLIEALIINPCNYSSRKKRKVMDKRYKMSKDAELSQELVIDIQILNKYFLGEWGN